MTGGRAKASAGRTWFVPPAEDPRDQEPLYGERDVLTGYLRFQRVMQGDSCPRPFRPNGLHSEEFTFPKPTDSDIDGAFTEWRRQCDATDEYVARTELDARGKDDVELREVLVHMIEEYARHLGHADLLRECIDGRRGQ